MISIKTHNVLDYVIAAVLVLCPYAFGFSDVTAARNVFLILGIGLAGYSLLTNYYYSVAKIIPLKTHMAMDCVAGAVLIVSAWLFGYRDLITGAQLAVHIIMGLGAIGLVSITNFRTPLTKSMDTSSESTTDFRRAA